MQSTHSKTNLAQIQAAFLQILPTIERQAQLAYHYLNFHDRQDAIAEVVAEAWAYYWSLADKQAELSHQGFTKTPAALSLQQDSEPPMKGGSDLHPTNVIPENPGPPQVSKEQWERVMLLPSMRFHGAGQS